MTAEQLDAISTDLGPIHPGSPGYVNMSPQAQAQIDQANLINNNINNHGATGGSLGNYNETGIKIGTGATGAGSDNSGSEAVYLQEMLLQNNSTALSGFSGVDSEYSGAGGDFGSGSTGGSGSGSGSTGSSGNSGRSSGGGSTGSSASSNNNSNSTSLNTSSNSSNSSTNTSANICDSNGKCTYVLMAPVGKLLGNSNSGKDYVIERDNKKGLCDLLNGWYKVGIGLAGLLAVVMLVIGGVEYATTDSITGASAGKAKITQALSGLILALCTYLIFNTINPALTKCELETKSVTLSTVAASTSYGIDATGGVLGLGMPSAGMAVSTISDQGSIAKNTQAGMTFPDSSWNDAATQAIKDSGILDLSPSDTAKYFPNGQVTTEGYVSLLASIAKSESGFNAADNTTAHKKDGSSSFSSEGLFSLGVGDSAVKSLANQKGVSPQEIINNPITNIQASVNIMKSQIQNQGSITGSSNSGYWGPLRRGE